MENGSVTPPAFLRGRRSRSFHPYRPVPRQLFMPLSNGGPQSRNFGLSARPPPFHVGPSVAHWSRRGFIPNRRALGTRGSLTNHPFHPNIAGEEQSSNRRMLKCSPGSTYSSNGSPSESEDSGSGICDENEYVPQSLVDRTEESVYKTGDSNISAKSYGNPPLLPGCVQDEDSFLEMHVACVAPGLLNKETRAAYGIWFGRQSTLNFCDILPLNRPQTLKAVLIWASTQGIQLMKDKGFIRLKLIMESNFMIQNVSGWATKFMDAEVQEENEKVAMCSNWDELKYVREIWELSKMFQGMLLKWTHVTSETHGIKCAKSLARHALSEKP